MSLPSYVVMKPFPIEPWVTAWWRHQRAWLNFIMSWARVYLTESNRYTSWFVYFVQRVFFFYYYTFSFGIFAISKVLRKVIYYSIYKFFFQDWTLRVIIILYCTQTTISLFKDCTPVMTVTSHRIIYPCLEKMREG